MLRIRLRIPRESFLVFPTSSTLYDLRGGVVASRGSGVVDGVALDIALAIGFDGGGKG